MHNNKTYNNNNNHKTHVKVREGFLRKVFVGNNSSICPEHKKATKWANKITILLIQKPCKILLSINVFASAEHKHTKHELQ